MQGPGGAPQESSQPRFTFSSATLSPPGAQAPREEAHCRICSAAMALWPPVNPASSPRGGAGTFSHPPAPSNPPRGAGCLGRAARARLYLHAPRPTAPSSPPRGQRPGATRKSGLRSHPAKRRAPRTPCLPPLPPAAASRGGTAPASGKEGCTCALQLCRLLC